jgi:hypothetical protein
MSSGVACPDKDHRPSWRVVQYHCNQSVFNGGRITRSPYSLLRCGTCDAAWRTKAAYVEEIVNRKGIWS